MESNSNKLVLISHTDFIPPFSPDIKVSCCLVVIIGVTMVVQPPLIFGVAEGETTKFTSKYLIGLAFAGSFLFSGKLQN